MRTMAAALAALAVAMSHASAGEIDMRVFELNDHLLSFYAGRPAEGQTDGSTSNWADFGAIDVGVATYVIRRGDRALVYDSFPSVQAARWAETIWSGPGSSISRW